MIDAQTTVNELPPFVNPALADFRIEGTASQWTGIPSTPEFSTLEVSVDLLGEPRNTLAPTKGCYEKGALRKPSCCDLRRVPRVRKS